MSIFGIIGLSFAAATMIALIIVLLMLFSRDIDDKWMVIIPMIVGFILTIAFTFLGIGINTEEAMEYRANFDAQKDIIEQSLELDELSGLERIDLVTKAAELNGEMAAKMVSAERWHVVFYDDTIYDDVELIKLDGGNES
jgi:apolipoprotein N-acyltransferase